MPNVPYPYEVNGKLVTENGFLICTNLFLIKLLLIAKFDCTNFDMFEEVVHNFGKSDDDMI
jgi:hypothetical protein